MPETKKTPRSMMNGSGGGEAVYVLGIVGAAVYYIQNAQTFGQGILGLLKAIVWPAIFVYRVLQFFNL